MQDPHAGRPKPGLYREAMEENDVSQENVSSEDVPVVKMYYPVRRMSVVKMYQSLAVLLVVVVGSTSAELTDECMACMCWASSNCTMKDPVCQIHEWGEVCGPWAITQPYWVDGGSHGEGFYSCVLDWQCNENTVRGYMAHYLPSPYAKCEDYARTHAGGPLGSSNDNTLPYWYTVKDCLDYSLFTPPTLL